MNNGPLSIPSDILQGMGVPDISLPSLPSLPDVKGIIGGITGIGGNSGGSILPSIPNPFSGVGDTINGIGKGITDAYNNATKQAGHYLVMGGFVVVIVVGILVTTRDQ